MGSPGGGRALDGLPDATPLIVDRREVGPTPAGVLGALGDALGCARAPDAVAGALAGRVLVLDAYAHFLLVDAWLRRELVRTLPAGPPVVAVGRGRPSAACSPRPDGPGWPSG